MQEYRQCLIDEAEELEEKIEKLNSFRTSDAFYEFDVKNQGLVLLQFGSMNDCAKILRERIELCK